MATKDKLKTRGKGVKAGKKRRKTIPKKPRKTISPSGTVGGRDPFRIGPVGGSKYGTSFTILARYDNLVLMIFHL